MTANKKRAVTVLEGALLFVVRLKVTVIAQLGQASGFNASFTSGSLPDVSTLIADLSKSLCTNVYFFVSQ